jgi:hypothetical protein
MEHIELAKLLAADNPDNDRWKYVKEGLEIAAGLKSFPKYAVDKVA